MYVGYERSGKVTHIGKLDELFEKTSISNETEGRRSVGVENLDTKDRLLIACILLTTGRNIR